MEKMKWILFEELDYQIQGADIYNTKTSKWLIFTDSKKWVLEYTNSNTLWYNYTFFNNTLIFFGMDCADADSKNMIKEWFESRFLGIEVEDTIQNGVKNTYLVLRKRKNFVDKIIQNGVKETRTFNSPPIKSIEDTIQNGVKETIGTLRRTFLGVDDIIQNGVKDTGARHLRINRKVEDAIKNGVKKVKERLVESLEQKDHMVTNVIITEDINYAIENGVKE